MQICTVQLPAAPTSNVRTAASRSHSCPLSVCTYSVNPVYLQQNNPNTLLVDIESQFGIEFADDVLVDGTFASVQTLAEVVVALGNRDS